MTKEAGLFVKDVDTPVALQGVKIETEVLDVTAKTVISQRYKNLESKSVEAVYCFPMQEDAAIYSLKVVVDDREIEAIAEEREKAFETYDKAIEKGDGAFLLDQEERDVFVLSVGNLKPDQEIVIKIEYAFVLHMVDDMIRLQIPTTVSPRYIPAGSDPVKSDTVSPPYADSVPYGLTLMVNVIGMDLQSISSPSHPVAVDEVDGGKQVSLSNKDAALDRDFILEMKPKQAHQPVCLVGQHENDDQAALIRFYPSFDDEDFSDPAPCDLLFILDCSGSMNGSSIQEAKTALELCLRSLNEGDMFNIICFGSTYETYAKEPVVFSEKSLTKVMKFVQQIDADLGGTELFETLKYACSIPVTKGFQRDVVLLTDGEVFDAGSIISHVTKHHGKSRFYTFGIGYGASQSLVTGLARVTRGAYEMIQPGESIEEKVMRQFSRLVQPMLDDICIEVSAGEFQFEEDLPPVYEGDAFTAFAAVDSLKDCTVTLSGQLPSGRKSWTCKVVDLGQNNTIPVLRAVNRIKYLEDHLDIDAEKHPSVRRSKKKHSEVLDLALAYNLMCSKTSFVAVEKRKKADKTFDPDYRRIPVMVTKDYGDRFNLSLMTGALAAPASPTMMRCCMASMTKNKKAGGGLLRKSAEWITDLLGGSSDTDMDIACSGPGLADLTSDRSVASLKSKELRSSIKRNVEWYIQVLQTQQVSGWFDALKIIADQLGKTESEILDLIKDRCKQSQISDQKLYEQAILTLLVIELINKDQKAKAVCGRAVKKAEKWLNGNIYKLVSKEELMQAVFDIMGV